LSGDSGGGGGADWRALIGGWRVGLELRSSADSEPLGRGIECQELQFQLQTVFLSPRLPQLSSDFAPSLLQVAVCSPVSCLFRASV